MVVMLLILLHKCSLRIMWTIYIYIYDHQHLIPLEKKNDGFLLWWRALLVATEVSHCFNFFYYIMREAHQAIIKDWQLNYRYVNINMSIKLLLIVSNLYSTFMGSGRRRVSLFVPSWSTLLPVPVSSFVTGCCATGKKWFEHI